MTPGDKNPACAVAISLIALLNCEPASPISAGLKALFSLSGGVLGPSFTNPDGIGFNPILDASPRSCNAIIFRIFSVRLVRFVTHTSTLVI